MFNSYGHRVLHRSKCCDVFARIRLDRHDAQILAVVRKRLSESSLNEGVAAYVLLTQTRLILDLVDVINSKGFESAKQLARLFEKGRPSPAHGVSGHAARTYFLR
jgi:hypothetical protein